MQQILNKYDDHGDIFLCDIFGDTPLKILYILECFSAMEVAQRHSMCMYGCIYVLRYLKGWYL